MKLYTSNYFQKANNTLYPNEVNISCLEDLKAAVRKDHIAPRMTNKYRNDDNFIEADCIMMDRDNTHSENPEDWKTIDDTMDTFPDVRFSYIHSRNHMKVKTKVESDGNVVHYEPREKDHFYFPLSKTYTDKDEYKKLMMKIAALFPYFDLGAAKPAQFFYGVEDPEGGEVEGALFIDQYLETISEEECKTSIKEFASLVNDGTYSQTKEAEKALHQLYSFFNISDEEESETPCNSVDEDDSSIGFVVDEAEQRRSLSWLENWAAQYNVTLGRRYRANSKEHPNAIYICVSCPWEENHTENGPDNEAVIIIDLGGKLNFLCRHNHCINRHWKDYRAYYEEKDKRESFHPLIPFEADPSENLPSFPLDALPDVLRDVAEGIAGETQFPIDGVVLQLFGIMSLCLMGKLSYQVFDTYMERGVNTYTMCIVPTGERKTTSLNMVTKPFYEYIEAENTQLKLEMPKAEARIKMAEKKKKILEKKIGEEPDKQDSKPGTFGFDDTVTLSVKDEYIQALQEYEEAERQKVKLLHPIMDDGTMEAIAMELQENNERMGIISDEGGIFQIMAGIYSKGQPPIDLVLKSYSGEPYHSRRVNRAAVDLDHPFLTIHLSVQPIVLKEASENERFKEQGLLARFLYCYPKSLVGQRFISNSKKCSRFALNGWGSLIQTLQSVVPCTIYSTDEAAKIMENFSDEIEGKMTEEYSDIQAWANRMLSHAARIAATLHAVKYGSSCVLKSVDSETVDRAIKITRYFCEHAHVVLNMSTFTVNKEVKDAKYIFSKLCKKRDTRDTRSFLKRDLLRLCRRFRTNEELQPGLDELVRRGYIRIEKTHNEKGSPESEIIIVNPDIPEK